ncbi:MAG: hypothetical protein DDT34_02417 [Firmicutes bacterium]|nr:hypothetical protein [Bacillota bacterium]
MDSWWGLGDGSGFSGGKLALYKITCPFCMESGNFSTEFHAEKKQPNGSKVLNFDTLKCGSCASFVQVVWSGDRDIHDFKVQPWPLKYEKAPDHFPEDVGRYWLQAKKSLVDRNYDAAAVMTRSAIQLALRAHKAIGSNLKQEIDDLASKGMLPPLMQEWAHNVRELGNDSAHPKPDQTPTTPKDATDIGKFMDFLFEYLYGLPKRIKDFRDRKAV